MKTIILFLIYLGSFMLFYLLFSLPFALFSPYMEVIQSQGWFIGYTVFFGWWLSMLPAREYYVKNENYFDEVF
jgi:hypothetical protein